MELTELQKQRLSFIYKKEILSFAKIQIFFEIFVKNKIQKYTEEI